MLRQAFQQRIYGELPGSAPLAWSTRTLAGSALDGAARLDLLTLQLGSVGASTPFHLALLTPNGDGPFPTIILSDFCGLDADIDPRLPRPSWRPERCRSKLGRAITRISNGDAILQPPVREIIAQRYAVAVFYAGDIAPDDPGLFRDVHSLGAGSSSGAIGAWASLYLSAFEVLRLDPRVSASQIALWGHSRYGKAALLAGALDERVAAVIANQSGTFGATLSNATRGETEAQIVRRFPHWFPERVEALTDSDGMDWLDQHLLLALLAPRPVLLGNAGLDRWSDPAASFSAARAASEAYALFASEGLAQPNMHDANLAADIAFYIRSGGHGVRSSDWVNTLNFLDAHFGASRTQARPD